MATRREKIQLAASLIRNPVNPILLTQAHCDLFNKFHPFKHCGDFLHPMHLAPGQVLPIRLNFYSDKAEKEFNTAYAALPQLPESSVIFLKLKFVNQ